MMPAPPRAGECEFTLRLSDDAASGLVLFGREGTAPFPGNELAGIASALIGGGRNCVIESGCSVLGQLNKSYQGPENKLPRSGHLTFLRGSPSLPGTPRTLLT